MAVAANLFCADASLQRPIVESAPLALFTPGVILFQDAASIARTRLCYRTSIPPDFRRGLSRRQAAEQHGGGKQRYLGLIHGFSW